MESVDSFNPQLTLHLILAHSLSFVSRNIFFFIICFFFLLYLKKKCPTNINMKRFKFHVLGLVFLSGCCIPEKLLKEGTDRKAGRLHNQTPK